MQYSFKKEIKDHIWKNQFICKMSIDPAGVYSNIYSREQFIYTIQEKNKPNSYMSLNPLKKIDGEVKRRKGYEASLKYLYIDLDVYNSDYAKVKKIKGEELKQKVVFDIKQNILGKTVPFPSFIVDSGRGLYLIWKIDEHINAMPRWEKTQRYLHEQLKYYGSDPQIVTDSVRVLRIPGSINTKSGTEVKIIETYNTKEPYTLYEIKQNYIPKKTPIITRKMEIAVETISKTKKIAPPTYEYEAYSKFIKENYVRITPKQPEINVYVDKMNLYCNKVIQDCTWLLLNTRDIPEGGKKEFLFFQIAFLLLRMGATEENTYQYITEVNNKMRHKKKEKKLLCDIKSAEWTSQKYEYCYSKKKLLEIIEITKEEEEALTYLKSTYTEAEKNRRKYEAKRRKNGQELNASRIIKRQAKVLEMIQNNINKDEIASYLGVSGKTIERDIKKIKSMTEFEIAALKEEISISLSLPLKTKTTHEKNNHEKKEKENIQTKITPFNCMGKAQSLRGYKGDIKEQKEKRYFVYDDKDNKQMIEIGERILDKPPPIKL